MNWNISYPNWIKLKLELGYLPDNYYTYYHRLYSEAERLCNDLIKKMQTTLKAWLLLHLKTDDVSNYEHEEISINDVIGYERKKPVDLSKVESSIITAWNMLNNASSLREKFAAINYALHLIHFNWERLFGIGRGEYVPDEINSPEGAEHLVWETLPMMTMKHRDPEHVELLKQLRELSEGELVEEWDREMSEFADNKHVQVKNNKYALNGLNDGIGCVNSNWYVIAQQKASLSDSYERLDNLNDKHFYLAKKYFYRYAQSHPNVSARDLALLYYYEKAYADLLRKKQSGQHLTDEEYKEFFMAKTKLAELVDKIGNAFRDIAERIAIVSESYYGTFLCPECMHENMEYDDDNGIVTCPNCGARMDEEEWERRFGVEHTDYGLGYVYNFINMWDDANTLNEKIVALHYIINAVHGLSGESGLMALFLGRSWLSKMKEYLDKLSAGELPRVTRQEGRILPTIDFQLDWNNRE